MVGMGAVRRCWRMRDMFYENILAFKAPVSIYRECLPVGPRSSPHVS